MEDINYKKRIEKNNLYYDRFANKVEERNEKRDYSKHINIFINHLNLKEKILDIGCGTGNHMELFIEKGFIADGIEPSKNMREICINKGLNVFDGTFEDLDKLKLPKYSGIWCAASLLHIPKDNLDNIIKHIKNVMILEKPLYFTVRIGNDSKWDKFDDESGDAERFIQLYEPNFVEEILNKNNFKIIFNEIEDSYWGRPSKWLSIIAINY